MKLKKSIVRYKWSKLMMRFFKICILSLCFFSLKIARCDFVEKSYAEAGLLFIAAKKFDHPQHAGLSKKMVQRIREQHNRSQAVFERHQEDLKNISWKLYFDRREYLQEVDKALRWFEKKQA